MEKGFFKFMFFYKKHLFNVFYVMKVFHFLLANIFIFTKPAKLLNETTFE